MLYTLASTQSLQRQDSSTTSSWYTVDIGNLVALGKRAKDMDAGCCTRSVLCPPVCEHILVLTISIPIYGQIVLGRSHSLALVGK